MPPKSARGRNASRSTKGVSDTSMSDTSMTMPFTCDVCKGSETIRSILQNDDVKSLVSKICELSQAKDELSEQVSKINTLGLNIQHYLINPDNPKSILDHNKKMDKLSRDFETFGAAVKENTDILNQLLVNMAEKPPPPPPQFDSTALLNKIEEIVSGSNKPQRVAADEPPPKPVTHMAAVPVKPFDELLDEFMDDNDLKELQEYAENETYETRGKSGRETSYYGEYPYRYGKTYHPARKIPPVVQRLVDKIKEKYPSSANKGHSTLLTKYINGNAYCPVHADNEPSLSPTDEIFTFSLFATRTMRYESIHTDDVQEVSLKNNSLLVSSRNSMCYWKHSIPIDTAVTEVRYSITIRTIMPQYKNSTYLYGDSNTAFIKFGSGPKTLGQWCPGKQIRAPRVSDLPAPADIPPVRNMIIHTGINDLRDNYTPLRPVQIVEIMEVKCAAIHQIHPEMKIMISPILPTRNKHLNNLVRETNGYIEMLCGKHHNLLMTNNNSFANKEGLLLESLSSRKANDIVHINLSGIIKLGLLFRSYVIGSIYNNVDSSDGSKLAARNQMGHTNVKHVSPMPDTTDEMGKQVADGGNSSNGDVVASEGNCSAPGIGPTSS